ncbi:MAG: GNAT family N-acetyltransferase [Bryobacterales bacterium]|nr:GNAT family N-acetyltransferase [Bryobacterales bacterium]
MQPLRPASFSAAAGMWRAELLEVYQDPAILPAAEDSPRFFRDIVYPVCESWWVVQAGPVVAAMMGLAHQHIAHLFVRPAFRSRGYGQALVDHAKSIYPQGLTVTTSASVCPFYSKLGFVIVTSADDEVRLLWTPPPPSAAH